MSDKIKRVGNLLNDENFSTVIEYSTQNNITPDNALNQIVSEWAGGDKIGRLKTTENPPDLSQIEQQLNRITELSDQVILKLRRASI